MLSEVFYWVFNMSIAASIAGVVILLLSKIRRIPRRIIAFLFVIPFLRMWIPIAMGSKYSLMSLISKFTTTTAAKTVVVYEDFSLMNHVMAADTYFPVIYKTSLLEEVFRIAAIVWIGVAVVLLLTAFIVYIAAMSELKDAAHLRDNIYISDKSTSPAVYGIVRERIIIPRKHEIVDLKFILIHENAHIKRKDNLWRILAIITTCIYWFNPMSWLLLKSFLTNLELACDETVLKKCGEDEKIKYAAVLLNCTENKGLYVSAFGGAKLRRRIGYICSYKKLSVLSLAAFFLLAVAVGYMLLTNAV